jgi:hypothetical protein
VSEIRDTEGRRLVIAPGLTRDPEAPDEPGTIFVRSAAVIEVMPSGDNLPWERPVVSLWFTLETLAALDKAVRDAIENPDGDEADR